MANGGFGAGIGQAAGSAVSGIVRAIGGGRDPGRADIERAIALLDAVQDPQFDFRQLTAPDLQFLAAIDPVTYEARVPEDVKVAAESSVRPAQLRALAGMEEIGREGMPLADRLAAQSAVEAIASEAGRGQEAILQNLAARGRLGAGMETQARLAGGRDLSQLRAEMGRGLAQEALARRFAGLQSAGAMAGEARGQDIARAVENAQMINNMNQYIAGLQTQAERDNALMEFQRRMTEAQERQDIENQNRLLELDVKRENVNRWNTLQDALADFRMRRATGQGGFARDLATSSRASQAAREGAQQSMAEGVGGLAGSFFDWYGQRKPSTQTQTPTAMESMNIWGPKEEDEYKRIRGY